MAPAAPRRTSSVRAKSGRKTGKKSAKPREPREAKLSRTKQPDGMSLQEWQVQLRQQHGREQQYSLSNVGEHSIFSEFRLTNPDSKKTYRIAIRGREAGDNYCSCPDFTTNALGTCKHIAFTLAKLMTRPGARAAFAAGWHPPFSEIFVRYGARREVWFQAGIACSLELRMLAKKYFNLNDSSTARGTLFPEKFAEFDKFLSEAGKLEDDLRCYDDTLAFIAEIRDAEHREQALQEAFPRGIRSAAFTGLLKVSLYDYQREGALFAAHAGRCLIGDEMGLGKTIQALGATEILARHAGVERVLVICPTSLKHQWEREIERFTERPTQVIGGPLSARTAQFQEESFYKITNYDVIHRDLNAIAAWNPDLVILDEAQRIKNWNTRASKAVKDIVSPFAIVLTGTPLENRLEELVSLIEFVDRHRLGPTYRFLHDHQVKDENGRVVGYRDLDRISQTLANVLIRRQKSQVLKELPPRIINELFVPMTKPQQELHAENREIVARIVQKWRRQKFLSEADQRRMTIGLQNMRMACDSTWLLDQETDHGTKADEVTELLGEILEQPNTKVVIFSQWVRMHEVLLRRINARGWGHVLFHGGIEGSKRKGLVDKFREDPDCRLFLSTDAGGMGLNLQHASVVINLDLPWNPAVLEQRIARAHRLGQSQPVHVYNFIAQGTIEDGMRSVLQFKKSLSAGVLDGGEKEIFLGGSRLTKLMETVESVTRDIPAEPAMYEPEETEADQAVVEHAASPSAANPELASEVINRSQSTNTLDALPTDTSDSPEPTLEAGPRLTEDSAGNNGHSAPDAGAGLAMLFEHGATLFQQLAVALRPQPESSGMNGHADTVYTGIFRPAKDPSTGRDYLRIDLPEPAVLEQTLTGLGDLLRKFQR